MDENGKFFLPMAELVAQGATVKDACQQCGCAARTGYRLSSDPAFRLKVNQLRTATVSESIGLLATATRTAVDRLVELSRSQDEAVALRACTAILDRFASLSENIDLRTRVEALEAASEHTQSVEPT